MNGNGKIVREAKVASEPKALIGSFASLGLHLARIGLELGPLSQWLYAAMNEAGLAVELLETRHRPPFRRCRSRPIVTTRAASRSSCGSAGSVRSIDSNSWRRSRRGRRCFAPLLGNDMRKSKAHR